MINGECVHEEEPDAESDDDTDTLPLVEPHADADTLGDAVADDVALPDAVAVADTEDDGLLLTDDEPDIDPDGDGDDDAV